MLFIIEKVEEPEFWKDTNSKTKSKIKKALGKRNAKNEQINLLIDELLVEEDEALQYFYWLDTVSIFFVFVFSFSAKG